MIIEDLALTNQTKNKFFTSWNLIDGDVKSDSHMIGFMPKYWFAFAGFMNNLPYLAKITMECTIYFHAYFTMWDVNLVPAFINFNNLSVMRHMA